MVPKDVQALAYVVLLAQEQRKNPALTPDQFKAQLRAQVKAGVDAARAVKEKK